MAGISHFWQPLWQNIMRENKFHMFLHSKMKVHFRAPLTHFLKSIMRDAGETYTFATESHFAPLDQLRGNMHRILCFYYAGIMRESQMQICPSSGTQDYAGSIPTPPAIFCAQAPTEYFFYYAASRRNEPLHGYALTTIRDMRTSRVLGRTGGADVAPIR